MSERDYVKWKDEYSVGVSYIDEQHKKFLGMINKLNEACNQGEETASKVFKITIRDLVEYVKFHFKTEEDVLIKYKYPKVDYNLHKREHEQFMIKILEVVSDFEGGKKFVPNQTARFLKNWLLQHIMVVDKNYAPFLKRTMV